jgi:hypothetical protein
MPAVHVTITKDNSRNGDTFLVRVFNSRSDIEKEKVSDCWEASSIQVDNSTLDYLEDHRLTRVMIQRHSAKEAKDAKKVYPVSEK